MLFCYVHSSQSAAASYPVSNYLLLPDKHPRHVAQVVKSVHYCEATKAFTTMEYRDVSALGGLPTSAVYPSKDSSGNTLTTEYGMCKYKDSQTIAMQVLQAAHRKRMAHCNSSMSVSNIIAGIGRQGNACLR